jgi:hypothetical protein
MKMLEGDLSVDQICNRESIEKESFERFLRSNRRFLKAQPEDKEIESQAAKEEAFQLGVDEIDRKEERRAHRPRAQQGEHAHLTAIIEELKPLDPVDDPLYMGVDKEGKTRSFGQLLLITVGSVFGLSVVAFGLKNLLTDVPVEIPRAPAKATSGLDLSSNSQAAETILAFANATTAEEKSKHVRRPDIVLPLMEKWYATHEADDLNWDEWKGRSFFLDGRQFVSMSFFQNNSVMSFEALFEVRDEGPPLLDWESFVAYSPLSWAEFREIRPVDEMAIRVYFQPSNLYYPPFDDADIYVPANLAHPESTVPLIGYVKKRSTGGFVLRELTKGRVSETRFPVIVKLRFPPGDSVDPNLVEITDVVQTNWITKYPE